MNVSTKPASLKVLMVEDSPADAELVLRALEDLPAPIEHLRVADETALRKALVSFDPHVVLSDFSMPGFSGQEALNIVRKETPHVPFLFVSGTIGEELAIEALRCGAMDYVLKDNLRRLVPAVERAIDAARHRTERAHIETALRESEERFRTIVESSRDWIWESEPDTRTTYSNGAIEHILGYRPDELLGKLAADLMHPRDRELARQRMQQLIPAGKGWERWRLRWRHRDGSLRVLESTATPRFNTAGELIGYRGVDQDITAQLQQQTRIQHLARIHAVLSALGNTILRARARDQLLKQACQVAVEEGHFAAACIGVPIEGTRLEMIASHGNQGVIEMVRRLATQSTQGLPVSHMRPGLRALLEARNIIIRDFASAEVPPQMQSDMAVAGIAAQIALPIGLPPWGVLGLFSSQPQEFDPEEVALLERLTSEVDYAVDFIAKGERLEYLAYHDPVTGLPNRSGFQQQVAVRFAQDPAMVGVVRLTIFNRIVDSRGRDFVEQLLRKVARQLQLAVGPGAIVAHTGDGVFLLAQRATGSVQAEVERLDALLREFENTAYEIDGERIFAHFMCGIAVSPEHGVDGETLERNAAAALGEAVKRKMHVEPFTDRIHAQAVRRNEIERNLYRAFEQDEFELFYQPKFDTRDQRLVGAEALMRWRHPETGLISPAEFIPVLEETGMIVQAGRWVMRTALETARAWRARGRPGLRIAVNVSARELRNLHFLDECRDLLEPHAGDQLLDIEVTESLVMEDIEHSIHLLQSLRNLGCKIAIDDFGTGYSSLTYLARLPADVIKIDHTFTAQLAHSPESMSLITNIITLAHSLSLKVVAEGVEEEEQVKLFRLLRCDELQGYLLGRPVPEPDFVEKHF
ncbi:MAG TPA: EAL domain-containing protein [Xanthomonadaceae bacterium]|jgi:PAS domain S-box-containing protein|nr:EAL domain-containing protein [Xanthomonadaceae bacterium]